MNKIAVFDKYKYMINKDFRRLEEAYLAVAQPKKSVIPVENEEVTTEPNSVVNAGPVDEPAPGVDATMVSSDQAQVSPPVELTTEPEMAPTNDDRLSTEDESEEDAMAIDNLNSIRESIMKVAGFCASGGHLEPWQQQKLAIAMDNLAGVARSLGSKCHG